VPRNTTVTVSATPAMASVTRLSHNVLAIAKAAKAAPQTATAQSIARPCRAMRPTGPDSAALTRPPTPTAVVSRPSVRGSAPKRSALMAGNSATGRPKTVADRSARNAPASTRLRPMYLIPAATARGPGRAAPADRGSAGSRATPYREQAKLAASMR
jgi:hypothetical protein